jgi:hypothetical protein
MSPPYPGPVFSLTVKNSAGQSIGDVSFFGGCELFRSRSVPRKLPDWEFDWGGTSVKQ